MPVRRDKDGRWRYRQVVRLHNGERKRISGSAPRHNNTKAAAKEAMRIHTDRTLYPDRYPTARKEVPTFSEWFEGRFWREWVIGRRNKPSEQTAKRSIFNTHLKGALGRKPLDRIGVGDIAKLRASLVEKELSNKRINNVLAVVGKAMRYAADVELIKAAPKIHMLQTDRPEIECWDISQYARMVAAAKQEGSMWHAAVCLAGEAGLRVGEVRALRWREDVDMIAGTITVNRQMCKGHVGTPKGRTKRIVPMTRYLYDCLRGLEVIREGHVVRNPDGAIMGDGQASHAIYRVCRRAGLPELAWHRLRHSFGTHAAMFGANPWKLMNWMGHKRIDETMRYVHFAEAHLRPLPEAITEAAKGHQDPDEKILGMLAARARCGKHMAKAQRRFVKPLGF